MEHLGQYVFEMTQAKVEMSKRGRNLVLPQEAPVGHGKDEKMDGEGGEVKADQVPDESELDDIT